MRGWKVCQRESFALKKSKSMRMPMGAELWRRRCL
ncbi:hypothetical protein SLEP1_g34921 [Rubroshorea leprosula]|uniref:Uncharacterized protein n=1 Tax=Rubroshorea leprosula TaxID=152421 RepID=A0AAV5KLV5_9ROSI|nr:hypothetical protein SLEP1_g34921 [Rubroshorea leprosula]